MDILEAKKLVCESGVKLVKEGLVARTWGNISARVDEKSFVITPSGRTYENLTPEDIVLINMEDMSYEGNIKPSSEKGLHAAAYKMRSDVNAVIHTHQMNASTVASVRREVTSLDDKMKAILGETVRCGVYGLPGTKKLANATAQALEGRNAALLANHGAACIGSTMDQAFEVAQALEVACGEFIKQEFLKQSGTDEFSFELLRKVYLERIALAG